MHTYTHSLIGCFTSFLTDYTRHLLVYRRLTVDVADVTSSLRLWSCWTLWRHLWLRLLLITQLLVHRRRFYDRMTRQRAWRYVS